MIPIPNSVAASAILMRPRLQGPETIRKTQRVPIWYKLLNNPLVLDKHGLFKEYFRAFNDTSDVTEYEKPNKYNFNLRGVK